jgi:hypothetical protein
MKKPIRGGEIAAREAGEQGEEQFAAGERNGPSLATA